VGSLKLWFNVGRAVGFVEFLTPFYGNFFHTESPLSLKGIMPFYPVELAERLSCGKRIQLPDRLFIRRRRRHKQLNDSRFLPARSCGQRRFRDDLWPICEGLYSHWNIFF
jgi:hypothetical protein